MTVRVPHEIDLRRFPAIPRATPQFERLDTGRTCGERVNDRIKVYWGWDDGNVVGSKRFFGPCVGGVDRAFGVRHGVSEDAALRKKAGADAIVADREEVREADGAFTESLTVGCHCWG
jgi:hypothetical protein